MLMQYHGIPMDANDDGGRPPYPLLKDLSEGEIAYVSQWLDHYQAGASNDGIHNVSKIIGYLKEFKEQQDSGTTNFKLPQKPQ